MAHAFFFGVVRCGSGAAVRRDVPQAAVLQRIGGASACSGESRKHADEENNTGWSAEELQARGRLCDDAELATSL